MQGIRMVRSRISRLAVTLSVACLLTGCGGRSDIGQVTGKVTLDGEPLPGASVTFQPQKGRPSMAVTESDGVYKLRYNADTTGAVVGEHTVEISTYRAEYSEFPEDAPDEGEPVTVPAVPERVPVTYNAESELAAIVDAGQNTFDFDLKSDEGRIPELPDDNMPADAE